MSLKWIRRPVVLIFVVLVLTSGTAAASSELAGSLKCPCGCGKFVSVCDCPTAEQGRLFIQERRQQGLSDAEIAEAYGRQFGQQFVEFVPKGGSGLSLWIIPPVALVAGTIVLFFGLKNKVDIGLSGSDAPICQECGRSVAADADYCPDCGTTLRVEGSG